MLIFAYCFKRKTLDWSSDFFKARVSTRTGTAFIFLSITLLTQLRTTKQIQADGTFKTVPNLFCQLFTLHFKAYKKVTILVLLLLRLFFISNILHKFLMPVVMDTGKIYGLLYVIDQIVLFCVWHPDESNHL
jgi:hypothetical protein